MSMTLGKDVSALFPDVLKNIATADLDQKKLVYLYLMCVWTCLEKSLDTWEVAHAGLGIMPNHIQTSASWQSILLFRTRKTRTLLYEHWR